MMEPREPKNDVDRSDDSAFDMFSGRFDSYDIWTITEAPLTTSDPMGRMSHYMCFQKAAGDNLNLGEAWLRSQPSRCTAWRPRSAA